MQIFTGIAASPGIAVGHLKLIDRHNLVIHDQTIKEQTFVQEIQRLNQAIHTLQHELSSLKASLRENTESEQHLFFIDTHLMILSDERLFNETSELITLHNINAESALRKCLVNYQNAFAAIEDDYLRERIHDVETVIERLLRTLTGTTVEPILPYSNLTIIAAHDLSPADILQMDRSRIIGMVTEIGGVTSHSSILARAFQLPAVVGTTGFIHQATSGTPVIVDGLAGRVILSPDQETFRECLQRKRRYEYLESKMRLEADKPAVTVDGHQLLLKGNVEIPQEGDSILANGGAGIGLYRTEMLFMNRPTLPDEEEQFQEYRAVQLSIAPLPLTIRTLDAGGDKLLDGLSSDLEQNPALGVRAIRLSLTMPDEFKKQLRAILRISVYGTVRIMFPMISGLEELRQAKLLLEQCKHELTAEGIPFDHHLAVGIMIEIPSAVTIADLLAREADFFSIGTNDLIQYTLALDRTNQALSPLYQPFHPAVIRSLARIVSVAHEAGIEACICGEMAGEPLYLPLLLGLGYDELSMGTASIPRVKQFLRRCSFQEATRIAANALTYATAAEVEAYIKQEITSRFAESFD